MAGITLYLQPVQDLTLDTTVSRTQYQFMLESADAATSRPGCRSWSTALRSRPSSPTSPATWQDDGLAAYVEIDRDTAARFGISVGTVDNALYDAFGQRIVSTIFTQSNQYRVIMEADPAYLPLGRFAGVDLRAVGGAAARCRCRRSRRSTSGPRRC